MTLIAALYALPIGYMALAHNSVEWMLKLKIRFSFFICSKELDANIHANSG